MYLLVLSFTSTHRGKTLLYTQKYPSTCVHYLPPVIRCAGGTRNYPTPTQSPPVYVGSQQSSRGVLVEQETKSIVCVALQINSLLGKQEINVLGHTITNRSTRQMHDVVGQA